MTPAAVTHFCTLTVRVFQTFTVFNTDGAVFLNAANVRGLTGVIDETRILTAVVDTSETDGTRGVVRATSNFDAAVYWIDGESGGTELAAGLVVLDEAGSLVWAGGAETGIDTLVADTRLTLHAAAVVQTQRERGLTVIGANTGGAVVHCLTPLVLGAAAMELTRVLTLTCHAGQVR